MAENLAMSAEVGTAGFLSLGKSTEDRTKNGMCESTSRFSYFVVIISIPCNRVSLSMAPRACAVIMPFALIK